MSVTFASQVTEAKAHSEYAMEQEVKSQIPRSTQNENQRLAVYLSGVLGHSHDTQHLKKLFEQLRVNLGTPKSSCFDNCRG
ncbi:hypothetical protein H6F41_16245 [Pseudanabaena sp. FACHB-723]|uniref:Uncharacterized protein n=1 Tax=Pseudanabaena mucicola FACHB-723 TaxID=2692860 RepID=A0ABR8A0F3_9CYAN|nr:hypothetical protein [Pseudanabaena mucicola FACHB-723]